MDEETLEAVRKLIDYDCATYKEFFDMCNNTGDLVTKKQYQSSYNALVILKEKITQSNLKKNKEAYKTYKSITERIFIEGIKC